MGKVPHFDANQRPVSLFSLLSLMRYSRCCAIDGFGRRVRLVDGSLYVEKVHINDLEALAVDNGGSGFVVLGLGDPHSLEGRERGKDGTLIHNY